RRTTAMADGPWMEAEGPGAMRVIVFGGRDMRNPKPIYRRLGELEVHHSYGGVRVDEITVVHGDARGADTIADVCARLFDFEVEPHPADWRPGGVYDPQAGHRRNQEMCDAGADLACGYWDGSSRGTKSMIEKVLKAEIPLEVYTYDGVPLEGYRGLL